MLHKKATKKTAEATADTITVTFPSILKNSITSIKTKKNLLKILKEKYIQLVKRNY